MSQRREEIESLYELVRELRPRAVLEIGLDSGGTFLLWSRAATADSVLVAVDSARAWPFGRWSPFAVSRRAFATADQHGSSATSPASESACIGFPLDAAV